MKFFRLLFLLTIIISSCARIGLPEGGDKDTIPPKVVFSSPENQSVNFKNNEITLQFDEYVVIKDAQKNLLISPPVENPPQIIPNGIASKKFKLIFKNGLKPNTTYSINFGESIADFNENNVLKDYQLVFSTGPQIDSLQFSGKVIPIYQSQPPKKIIVGLYQADTFKDSLVFTRKPYYVTVADQTGNFTFNHLKQGVYKLIAVADNNNDYKYKQGEELIGFSSANVIIPTDTLSTIYLFQEHKRPSIDKIEQISRNHIEISFKGNPDSLQIKNISPVSKAITLHKNGKVDYWYESENDSIHLSVNLQTKKKKFRKKRIEKKDSLVLRRPALTINPIDTLRLSANMPLITLNKSKVVLLKDSITVTYDAVLNSTYNFDVFFEKTPGKTYQLIIYPNGLSGFSEKMLKDTIQSSIRIPAADTYGTLTVTFENLNHQPAFVELLQNGNVIRKTTTQSTGSFQIKYLKPGKYQLRLILDANQNNLWDTGNYLQHKHPEQTFMPNSPIEIRANWEVNQKYQ
jgi:uncharacterized protein (DUF2141 family)